MDVTPLIGRDRKVIQSYGVDGFRISSETFARNVVVFPDHVEDFDSLPQFLAQKPDLDVLVFGSSRGFGGVDFDGRQQARAQKIIIEAMDLGAACRTYNVLMAEGRRVAAILIFDSAA
ncbi:MAG: hypothetical protein GC136_10530 [Alphaproteobacteria bacterium]|nr:hypothetical protein [Alphaproteobacteria bacterium]